MNTAGLGASHMPFVEYPRRPQGRKDAPIFTEQRGQALAESLGRERCEAIHEEARRKAAEIMRRWSERTGK